MIGADLVLRLFDGTSLRPDASIAEPQLLASVPVLPPVRIIAGGRPVAMKAGAIDSARPNELSVVIVTDGWLVLCFDSSLRLRWETSVMSEPLPMWLRFREAAIALIDQPVRVGDTGAVVVGGRLERRHARAAGHGGERTGAQRAQVSAA